MSTHLFRAALALTVLLAACQHKEAIVSYTCTGPTPVYSTQIKPILDTKCAFSGCHSASSRAAGIDLSSYASVTAEAANDAFLGSIEHRSGYKSMPQSSVKLPDSTIQKIYCWVNNGQPE